MTLVPNSPSELDLPVQEWRPQQQFAVASVIDAFDSGKRFVFLNGATGIGKSIIAAAVGRVLGDRTEYLTHTKQLQAQYLRTMRDATIITGKSNHRCGDRPDLTAEDCERCESPTECGYWKQMFDAEKAQELVTNYAYATRMIKNRHVRVLCSGAAGECGGCNPVSHNVGLLVCDEGHLAEQAVVDAVKVEVKRQKMEKYGFRPPMTEDAEEWMLFGEDNVERISRLVGEAWSRFRISGDMAEVRELRAISMKLNSLAGYGSDDDNIAVSLARSGDAEVRPLWGWNDAKPLLFGSIPKVILMSATLGDPKILARKLGIGPDEYQYLDLPSPFPLENRTIWRWPVLKVNARSTDLQLRGLAATIDNIAESFPNRKGIVHTASHKLAQKLAGYSRMGKRLLVHGSRDRMEALERYKRSTEPLVLMSASFTTGLDLPGLIGWQVVAKVPFGNLGDPITKWRMQWGDDGDKFGSKNYAAEAMNTVVQACGRGVRSMTDKCHTYILDSNFNHLSHSAHMPESFKEALQWVKQEGGI